jgi:hypothetical protein
MKSLYHVMSCFWSKGLIVRDTIQIQEHSPYRHEEDSTSDNCKRKDLYHSIV